MVEETVVHRELSEGEQPATGIWEPQQSVESSEHSADTIVVRERAEDEKGMCINVVIVDIITDINARMFKLIICMEMDIMLFTIFVQIVDKFRNLVVKEIIRLAPAI